LQALSLRDETTYENFKISFPKSFNGMDCAFFLSDAFSPAPLRIDDYVVYNFDHMEVPYIEEHNKRKTETDTFFKRNMPKEHQRVCHRNISFA